MLGNLLIDTQLLIIIIAASVGGVILILSIVLGAVRGFSRMTWIGWEMLPLFGLLFVFALIPMPQNPYAAFFIELAGLTLIVALILGLDVWIRHLVLSRPLRAGKGLKALDRIFGVLTVFVTLAMFALVVGGFVLAFVDAIMGEPVLNIGLWTDFLSKYAVDLFLGAVLYLSLRAGYRLGLLKTIYYLLAMALTVLAFILACKTALNWSFIVMLSEKIAAGFSFAKEFNSFLGFAIMSFVVFVVYFAAVMGLMVLVNWGIRSARKVEAVGIVDGAIAAVIAFAIFTGVYLAIGLGVHSLAGDALSSLVSDLPEEAQEFTADIAVTVGDIMQSIENAFVSSPISKVLYTNNFIGLLIG